MNKIEKAQELVNDLYRHCGDNEIGLMTLLSIKGGVYQASAVNKVGEGHERGEAMLVYHFGNLSSGDEGKGKNEGKAEVSS